MSADETKQLQITATIDKNDPRAQEWLDIMEGMTVPLTSFFPEEMLIQGAPRNAYMLDIDALTDTQRANLIKHIAEKFNRDQQEVDDTIDEIGCPVLSENIAVTCIPKKH